jgi:hypothetical protein
MFNKIKNGEEYLLDWKIATICPIYMGKGNRKKPGNCRGISPLSVCGKIFSGIVAGRLRDWLIYHKVLSVFPAGLITGKRTRGNVIVFKTTTDKYLRYNLGRLY